MEVLRNYKEGCPNPQNDEKVTPEQVTAARVTANITKLSLCMLLHCLANTRCFVHRALLQQRHTSWACYLLTWLRT